MAPEHPLQVIYAAYSLSIFPLPPELFYDNPYLDIELVVVNFSLHQDIR